MSKSIDLENKTISSYKNKKIAPTHSTYCTQIISSSFSSACNGQKPLLVRNLVFVVFFIVERTTKRYQYTLPPVVYESGAHCVRVCARSRQPHTAQQNIVRFRTFSPRAVRPDWPGTHFRLTLFGGWSRKAFVCALAAAWHGAWSAEYGVAPLFQRRSIVSGKESAIGSFQRSKRVRACVCGFVLVSVKTVQCNRGSCDCQEAAASFCSRPCIAPPSSSRWAAAAVVLPKF